MHAHVVIANNLTVAAPNIGHAMPIPAVEAPVNVAWAMWCNASAHKLAASVTHKGQPIAQAYHDCGKLIPHLSPLDVAVGPAGSSRQILFSAMDVTIQGEPVGFAEATTPMLTCGLVPMPVGLAPGCYSNEVIVGMDPTWDFALGWVGTFLEMEVMSSINIALLVGSVLVPGSTLAGAVASEVGFSVLGALAGEMATLPDGPAERFIEGARARRGQGEPANGGPAGAASWDEI